MIGSNSPTLDDVMMLRDGIPDLSSFENCSLRGDQPTSFSVREKRRVHNRSSKKKSRSHQRGKLGDASMFENDGDLSPSCVADFNFNRKSSVRMSAFDIGPPPFTGDISRLNRRESRRTQTCYSMLPARTSLGDPVSKCDNVSPSPIDCFHMFDGDSSEEPLRRSPCHTVDKFDEREIVVPCVTSEYEYHRLAKPVSLPKYALGEEAHPLDMVIEANEESAKLATSLLRELDAAFVRRSDGRWCYAILAERITPKDDYKSSVLRFVVNQDGSTKSLARYKWGEYVRLTREPMTANALLAKLAKRVSGGNASRLKRNSLVSHTACRPIKTEGFSSIDLADPYTW